MRKKKTPWKITKLGNVISLDLDQVLIDPSIEYKMVGVYSFGKGLFDRNPVIGSETSYKKFNRLHSHHIIMSQLFGWEGALALCSKNFTGKFVSSQFPTFSSDEDLLNRDFLGWYIRQPSFWRELASQAKGMGDRRRTLNPNALLSREILLPPIDEQEEIVTKIESLNEKINEAKQLRHEISQDSNALLITMAHRNDLNDMEKEKLGWKKELLANVLTQIQDPVEVQPGKEYPHFGVYSFAKGIFKKNNLQGSEIKAKKLYRVHKGQFVYARLNAYEGAFSVITEYFDKHYLSNEFPTFTCNQSKMLTEFLAAYFLCPKIWEDLKRNVTGIGGGAGNRRIRLKESVFLSMTIWLPPIEWQEKIKVSAKKIEYIKSEQSLIDNELDALLPAILDKAFKGELV